VKARVVASEPAADLSLLQLERVPAGVRVARLANSSSVRVGDQVLVVGAPYGLAYSLSVGYVSARWPLNSVYPAFPLAEFFQTDARPSIPAIPAARCSASRATSSGS
jgi:S1-C subfamily serine protease